MDGRLKLSTANSSIMSPHVGTFKSKLGVAQLGSHGVVLNHAHWPLSERRTWVGSLFLGLVVLYLVRFSVPVAIVEMSEEMNWDKKTCVSGHRSRS